MDELLNLIKELNDSQLEAVAGFVRKTLQLKATRFTGEVVYTLTYNQGGISAHMRINMGETVKLTKKRRVRSPGVK